MSEIPDDLREALRTINRLHSLEGAVYDVRERADCSSLAPNESSWDHPDVQAYSGAVKIVERYIA